MPLAYLLVVLYAIIALAAPILLIVLAVRQSTLRIGTMGMTASPHYVLPTLSALEMTLRELGHAAEPGAGVGAAQVAFAAAA